MKAFLDYLCELSASDSPKYSLIHLNYKDVSKRIIGNRVGKKNPDWIDTIIILDFQSSVNEWRSFDGIQAGNSYCYLKWFLTLEEERNLKILRFL